MLERRTLLAASISGVVFNDLNVNGVRDAGETGVASRTVYLDQNDNDLQDTGEPAAATDSSGAYTFAGLSAGRYVVQTFDTITAPATGTHIVTVGSDDAVTTRDFGLVSNGAFGSIRGRFFNDDNANGLRDPGETVRAGQEVVLQRSNNSGPFAAVATVTTDADGRFGFGGLQASGDSYRVGIADTTGVTLTGRARGSVSAYSGFDHPNVDLGIVAGLVAAGRMSYAEGSQSGLPGRTVYVDANNNDAFDTGEPSVLTDSGGGWRIVLPDPGSYTFRTVLPAGWRLTWPTSGDENTAQIVVSDGVQNAGVFVATDLAYISGRAYEDLNGNGAYDGPNVDRPYSSSLTDYHLVYDDANHNGVLDTGEPQAVTHNVDCTYTIKLAAGSHRLRLTKVPPGMSYPGGLDHVPVTVTGAEIRDGVDVPLRELVPPQVVESANGPITFGVTAPQTYRVVYTDNAGLDLASLGNDLRITGPNGFSAVAAKQSVRIEPTNGTTVVTYAFTPPGGSWGVSDAGTYAVELLAGEVTDLRGNAAAAQALTGFTLDPMPALGRIAGTIYNDSDADGVRDAGETGLAGRVVFLDTNDNDVFDSGEQSVQTDSSGNYAFDDAPADVYVIKTAGAVTGPRTATHIVLLASGENATGYDFGINENRGYVRGRVFNDTDGDGMRDAGETPRPGQPIKLEYWKDQVHAGRRIPEYVRTIGTTTSDADGRYAFPAIPRDVGYYKVVLSEPGMTFTGAGSRDLHDVNNGTDRAHLGAFAGSVLTGQLVPINGPVLSGWTIFHDANNNDALDAGERSTVTDAVGWYWLGTTATGPQAYRVVVPAGWRPYDLGDGEHTVNISTVTRYTHHFYFTSNPAIAGRVFDDPNRNGQFDAGERFFGGVKVYVDLDNDGVADPGEWSTTTSTIDGRYLLSRPAGTYRVRVANLPPGEQLETPMAGYHDVTLSAPAEVAQRDFTLRDVFWPSALNPLADAVTAGATSHNYILNLSDNTSIDLASIGNGDVRVTGPNGFSQFLTLSNLSAGSPPVTTAQATYTFAPPGGSWDAADNGTYTFQLVGNEVFDATGNAAVTFMLSTLVVNLPVTPTTLVTLRPTADAFVRDGSYAGTNFGGSGELHLKRSSSAGSTREFFLKFDLSSVGSVANALLRLNGRIDHPTQTALVGVYPVANTSWTEAGINWNNRPTTTAGGWVSGPVATGAQKYYEWNLGSYLAAEKAAGRNTVTLLVRSLTNTDPYLIFASDEGAANRPELVITPGAGTPTPTPTPTQQPFKGTPFASGATPVTIQAEDYDLGGEGVAYHDATPSNSGGAYRSGANAGVDLKVIAGTSGGQYRVSDAVSGEWLEYTVDVAAAGQYDVEFRVAHRDAGATFRLERHNGDAIVILASGTVPDTNSFDTFATVTRTVSLQAGPQVLRFHFGPGAGGYAASLDWMRFSQATTTPTPTPTPTPTTLVSTTSAFVRDGSYAGQNYNADPTLTLKYDGVAGNTREAYLTFDLTSMSSLTSAKLRLNGKLADTRNASVGVNVFNADNTSWTETGLTWNNRPAAGTAVRGSFSVAGTTSQWYEVDLTGFLQAELAAGRKVVTLVLKVNGTNAAPVTFASDEQANGPRLIVS